MNQMSEREFNKITMMPYRMPNSQLREMIDTALADDDEDDQFDEDRYVQQSIDDMINHLEDGGDIEDYQPWR